MLITKTRKTTVLGAFVAAAAALMAGFGASVEAPKAKVGAQAPDFTLADLTGKEHTLSDFTKDGKVVVLEWFNPECPFVKKHYRDDTQTMNKLVEEFAGDDLVWIRVNSGAEGKEGAGVELNTTYAKKYNITTPILMDMSGEVGKMYDAKRTPEMYIIDTDGVLRYHGAIDNDKGARDPGDVNYVRNALREMMAGQTITTTETKAYGCSVKYAG